MCFKCYLCHQSSRPRQVIKKHVIYRDKNSWRGTRKEIAREVPICDTCDQAMKDGVSFERLEQFFTRQRRKAANFRPFFSDEKVAAAGQSVLNN